MTAFEVFTFNLPWEKHPGSMQTFVNHINSPGRDPREFRPDLDAKTVAFLTKSIERDPARSLPDRGRLPGRRANAVEKALRSNRKCIRGRPRKSEADGPSLFSGDEGE